MGKVPEIHPRVGCYCHRWNSAYCTKFRRVGCTARCSDGVACCDQFGYLQISQKEAAIHLTHHSFNWYCWNCMVDDGMAGNSYVPAWHDIHVTCGIWHLYARMCMVGELCNSCCELRNEQFHYSNNIRPGLCNFLSDCYGFNQPLYYYRRSAVRPLQKVSSPRVLRSWVF